MTTEHHQPESDLPAFEGARSPAEDRTGRSRMVRNVLSSWGGHFVFIVAGFIVPRLISDHLGRAQLGVWDFGWTVVAYFSLLQGGVVSSVNRYVARYWAADDIESVNRTVSSVTCVLVVMATIVVLLSIACAWAVPWLLSDQLGPHVYEARWVLLILGVASAFQMACGAFGGLLTGCHRWDLHNGIWAAAQAVTVVAMVMVVSSKGSLVDLAVVTAVGHGLGRAVPCWFAHRVCPGLRIRLGLARWSTSRNMLVFGSKVLLPQVAELIVFQGTNVVIVASMGPGALALFARPRALIRHVRTLVQKLAYVSIPTVSSYQASQDLSAIRELLIKTARYCTYLTLPMMILLVVLGDSLLAVWMGDEYREGLVLMILAIGYLLPIMQQGALSTLTGLNEHGRPGLANLLSAIAALVITIVTVTLMGHGLEAAALSVAVPVMLAGGLYVPWHTCRRVGLNLWEYLWQTSRGPLLCAVPFTACLLVARHFFDKDAHRLLAGMISGGLVLGVLYWIYVVPSSIRERVFSGGRRGKGNRLAMQGDGGPSS